MSLAQLLYMFHPGSGDWSWAEGDRQLSARPEQKAFEADILENGVTEPVLWGDDGRVWGCGLGCGGLLPSQVPRWCLQDRKGRVVRSKVEVEAEVRYFMHQQQDAEKAAFIEGAKWAMRRMEGALEDLNVK